MNALYRLAAAVAVLLAPTAAHAQDPAGSGPINNALAWMQNTLLGSVATAVAVMAVAAVGFMMLTGRMNWRFGATVILGCFIIFGAAFDNMPGTDYNSRNQPIITVEKFDQVLGVPLGHVQIFMILRIICHQFRNSEISQIHQQGIDFAGIRRIVAFGCNGKLHPPPYEFQWLIACADLNRRD